MNHALPASLNLDLDRLRRCGFAEVVFGAGKTVDEIVAAAARIHAAHGQVLVTRAKPEALAALGAALPKGRAYARSGCFSAGTPEPRYGDVAVVSAGTADEPVAEECEATLAARAVRTRGFRDCGVAGLHRILDRIDEVRSCCCVVVIAGMDGALPSVIGGLIDVPLVACPTSVGYGVADGGRTALHAMLVSCAPGLTVVNIDNGFGAGYAAATIARTLARAT